MPTIATLTLNPALDVETATETVRDTHKLRCGPPRIEPGGGGINVARVTHALGGDVVAVFPQGGPTGATFAALLGAAGIPTLAVPIAGAMRESFTADETSTGKQYRFVLPGPELAAHEVDALFAAIEAMAPAPDFVVASGSLPVGCDPAVFKHLCELCARIGARLVVDTSGPPLAALEGSCAYLIKPSLREVEELVGRPLTSEAEEMEAARELQRRGFADVVVVSLAERGALLAASDCELRMPAIRVPEGSAVGAGDSMVAALVLALSRGWGLEAALRYGVAAGAAALTAPGTELARRQDVERLYAAASTGAVSTQNSA